MTEHRELTAEEVIAEAERRGQKMSAAERALERAREALQTDRSPKTLKAYEKASRKVANARVKWRKREEEAGRRPGPRDRGPDAAPLVDTVKIKTQVQS